MREWRARGRRCGFGRGGGLTVEVGGEVVGVEEVAGFVTGGAEEAEGKDQVAAAVCVGVSSVEKGSCTESNLPTS